ncbi:hypothetical protein Tco_0767931 [Tanacetum coccineum]
MANIRTCNKHNMIACVEKTEQNADFHQIIDFIAGCSINYSLLVDPDLIGPWLQQFWSTASLKVINDVPHISAMVAGKKIYSEKRYEPDLLLKAHGVWKYLVHVLLHCLSPKSTSWEQFGTNIASALVGLATNQKFNFSLMIMNGMLGHISNGTPFIMYPRFIQLFLNKQLEGVSRPKHFLPSVTLPSKVFTFMRKHSPKFSGRITPLTPSMLEVATTLAAEEANSASTHSRAETTPRDDQGTPTQSAAQDNLSTAQHTADIQGTAQAQSTADTQGTAQAQSTDDVQGTHTAQGTTAIPKSPNDYTPTDASQTSKGDEGLLDLYALNREVKRLKRQTLSQAKQINKLKAKLKTMSKMVKPVVKHHTFWVASQEQKKRKKKLKKQKKKVSSVKLGRNKDEGTLSEEHYGQEDSTAEPFFDDFVDKDAADLERKSDETEEINIEEKEASNVKSGDTEELDLETTKSTARQGQSEEQLKVDEVLVAISRPRGLSIPGSIQTQPQQSSQEPWKLTNDEDGSRKKFKLGMGMQKKERNKMMNFLKGQGYKNLQKLKYPQMKELYDKVRESIKDSFKDFIPMGSEKERAFDTLWEILHILDRQDLYHLYRVVQDYYEHIPPTGLGLILLGDLFNYFWVTPEKHVVLTSCEEPRRLGNQVGGDNES